MRPVRPGPEPGGALISGGVPMGMSRGERQGKKG
ncbi:hypothetical protein STANM337S_06521 [Streptomyces tanashiensis]